MKLEVTKWILDFTLSVLKNSVEFILRILLFLLPLGVYLFLLEFRSKVSSISNLSVFTTEKSVWQHIYPGFILVAIDPNLFKAKIGEINNSFQKWIEKNKYTLAFLAAFLLVCTLFLNR